jgi:uncharacterized membrane protein
MVRRNQAPRGNQMTEDQIERRVERKMDALDRAYMRGDISEPVYNAYIKQIHDWAEMQLRYSETH